MVGGYILLCVAPISFPNSEVTLDKTRMPNCFGVILVQFVGVYGSKILDNQMEETL